MPTRSVNPTPQYFDNAGNILVDGKMFYFQSGTNDALDTFADEILSIPNPQPVPLTADGRLPNVWFDGSAKQILTGTLVINGSPQTDQTIWTRDPVGGANVTGQFSSFNILISYSINDIVEGSDGLFYISLVNANQGNDPTVPSPTKWSEFRVRHVYNAFEVYNIGNIVQDAPGNLWRSVTNSNVGNTPASDGGTNWLPAVDAGAITEIDTIETRTTTVIPQTGAVTLTALRINELQDAGPFEFPLANNVSANQIIIMDFPSTFEAFEPVVNSGGSDTITNVDGTDTSITFKGTTRVIAVSDGISDWRI